MDPLFTSLPGYTAETTFTSATEGLSEAEQKKLVGSIQNAISAKVSSLASKTLFSGSKTEEKEADPYDILLTEKDVTTCPTPKQTELISYIIEQKTFILDFKNTEGTILARTTIRKI